MKPEPVAGAIEAARSSGRAHVVLLAPVGKPFDQAAAKRLSEKEHLVLVCGRYEGIDQRAHEMVDEELSVGDYVLSGGEPAALVVADAVTRLVPGVLGHAESPVEESFSEGLLEYPQRSFLSVICGQSHVANAAGMHG